MTHQRRKRPKIVKTLLRLNREHINIHSHEAVDRRHVVPRAKQEKREANDDEEAAQIDEGVLREEPPETGSSVVDGDVLTLGRKKPHAEDNQKGPYDEQEEEVIGTCMK